MSKEVTSFINLSTTTVVERNSSYNNELRSASPDLVTSAGSVLFCGFSAGPQSRHLIFGFNISSLVGKNISSALLNINFTADIASPPLYGAIRRIASSVVVDSGFVTWNHANESDSWDDKGGTYEGSSYYITFPETSGDVSYEIKDLITECLESEQNIINILLMPLSNQNDDPEGTESNITVARINGNNTVNLSISYVETTQKLLGQKICSGPDYTLSNYLNNNFSNGTPGNYGVKDDRNDAGGTNMINTRADDPNSNSNMTIYGANHIESSATRVTNPSLGSLDVTISGNTVTNNDATLSVTNNGAIVTSTTDPASSTSTGARVTGKTLPTNTSTGVRIVNT